MTRKYKIVIVEDDLLIAEMLKEMLLELNYSIVSICKNYHEATVAFDTFPKIDLVFLDINISSKKTGIDLGLLLNEKHKHPFIYLTSYSDPITIKSAIKTMPQSYLLKPFTKSDLFSAIELVKMKSGKPIVNSIVIKDGGSKVRIKANDILFIRSDKNYLEIETTKKRIVTRCSLEAILTELDDQYIVRSHRSYAVNINKIDSLSLLEIEINGDKIPLSRKYKEAVHREFEKF